MAEQVWTHGYNSCLHVAISALNYLSSHSRPVGGQEAYNSEHLLQIADEVKRTIAHNVKVTAVPVTSAWLRNVGDEDECWVVCAKGDPGALCFAPVGQVGSSGK